MSAIRDIVKTYNNAELHLKISDLQMDLAKMQSENAKLIVENTELKTEITDLKKKLEGENNDGIQFAKTARG